MDQARRNDPCPCGSGLKYKKCCLAKTSDNTISSDEISSIRAKAFKDLSEENWYEAIKRFNSILDDVHDPHLILEAIASCHDGLEDYLKAAEFYEKALEAGPESRQFENYYRLGIARACAQRIDKAADAFRKCLEYSSEPAAKDHLNQLLHQLKEIEEGKKDPRMFLVHVQLQRAFSDMEADRYEQAADRLERLVAIEPENSAIFYNLGVVYTFLGREDEAIGHFEKAVELSPDYVQAWYNMGQICLIKKKDFSRALNYFDRAITARPDYIGAHHQRGVAYELVGDKRKAIECWEKTLELDPENKQAKENIERVRDSA
jgi:tetratricopeptide (TPR) repeat protein